ncbi:MAG TPA: hypothetical protein VMC02_15675, partial [Steroidobacteraceae bacterium]|nr:hypothetical protein [Steroidobacteraceae bacterium]
ARAKFINAKPVYFPPMEHRWSNDDYGNGSYKTAVFHDLDGSVDGVPGSFILINDEEDGIAIDTKACRVRPTWNAAVCKGDVGRLSFGSAGGPGGPGAPGRPGAAAGAGGPGGPGGAARAGAAAGPPGGGFPAGTFVVGGARPTQPPVVLSRNGKDYSLTAETNVLAGSEFKVTTARPSLSLNVKELDSGSWVLFELPGFATAASGSQQSSLDALRKASTTSYYKGDNSLWVKLVSSGDVLGSGPGNGPSGGASLQVSR